MSASQQAPNNSNGDPDAPQWETSKENVAPLREGRDVKALNKALASSKAEIEQTRQTYMAEITATESGDDPLEAWANYTKWAVQNYPSGSPELLQAVETPCRWYGKSPQYKHDSRMTRLWVQYADMRSDKLDVYSYMKKHGIGEKCALFYEAWAATLEMERNYDMAEKVYMLGTEKRAEPTERLAKRNSEFRKRCIARAKRDQKKRQAKEIDEMMKKVNAERDGNLQKDRSGLVDRVLGDGERVSGGESAGGDSQGRGNSSRNETERPALGSINEREAKTGLRPQIQKTKTKQRKKGLGSSSSSGPKNGDSSGSSSNDKNSGNIQIEVFNDQASLHEKNLAILDENANDADDEMPERLLPTLDAVRKENDGIPSQWAGETLKQKASLGRNRLGGGGGGENFEVYEGSDHENGNESFEVMADENKESIGDSKANKDHSKNRSKGLSIRKQDDCVAEAGAQTSEEQLAGIDVDMLPPSPTINTRIAQQVLDESLDRGHGPMSFLGQKKDVNSKSNAGLQKRADHRELFKPDNDMADKTSEMTINMKMAVEAVDEQFNAPLPSMLERHHRVNESPIGPSNPSNNAEQPMIEIYQDEVAPSSSAAAMFNNSMEAFKIHEDDDISGRVDVTKPTKTESTEENWFVDFFDQWARDEPGFRFLANDDPTDEQLLGMFDLQPEIEEGGQASVVSLHPIALINGTRKTSVVVLAEDLNNVFDLRKPAMAANNLSDDESGSDLDCDEVEQAQIAVKVSDPLNIWEYYIYRLLETRQGGRMPCSIGRALAYYEGHKRSFLLLDRVTWATLRELTPNNTRLNELVCMLTMVDLLRAVEHCHSCHVIHMDISTENVLFRFKNDDQHEGGWATKYARDWSNGWEEQGVLLVDFNRSIDALHASVGPDLAKHVSETIVKMDGFGKGLEWGFNYDCHAIANVMMELVGKTDMSKEDANTLNYDDTWTNVIERLCSTLATDGPDVTVKCMKEMRSLLEDVLENDSVLGRHLQNLAVKVRRMQTKHEEKKKKFK